MGLSGHCLGEECLSRSGRAHKQGSLGKLGADLGVFSGIVQEIHNLRQGLLGLVLAGHIFEGDAGLLLDVHLGVALSHAHDAASAHALHGEIHEENEEQEGQRVVEHCQEHRVGVAHLPDRDHIIFQNTVHKLVVPLQPHHVVLNLLGIVGISLLGVHGNLGVAHADGLHLALVNHFHKLIIR